jgi:hypothetical protein
MLEKMLEKWKKVHKEKTVALKWASSWESTITTRVEMNTQNLLRAGIPTDNNAVEGSNRWDKSLFNYSKDSIAIFLPRFRRLMEGHSRMDMSFGFNMKSRVHCREFYQSVEAILQRHRNNLPSIFLLQFPFSAVKHGVSKGSMLVAGENCLNDLESIFSSSDGVSDIDDIEDCRQFLLRNQWVEEYKQIVRDPVTRCEDMSFDEINSDMVPL